MEMGLKGRKVAILATDGVEQVELEEPRRALDAAGATTHLIAPKRDAIQAMSAASPPTSTRAATSSKTGTSMATAEIPAPSRGWLA